MYSRFKMTARFLWPAVWRLCYPDAVFVAVDGCATFVPLYKSHPPPSRPCILLPLCDHVTGSVRFHQGGRDLQSWALVVLCKVSLCVLKPGWKVTMMDTSQSGGSKLMREIKLERHELQQPCTSCLSDVLLHVSRHATFSTYELRGCLFLFTPLQLPLRVLLVHHTYQEKVVYQSPWSILMLPPCKPACKWSYTRIYWLILLFQLRPSGRAVLLVKLLNYQWGFGSWTEADPTTRSNKSITWISDVNILHF